MENKIYSGSSAAADETLRRSHHLSEQLADITAKVLRFTNAGGAAIAIGAADVAVTKAASGDLAPDLETPIRLEGSFAGLCIREGELLYCEDAENDSRVDAATSAAMGLRSMVMVPIGEREKVCGVLAAFSGVPGAFRPTHIAVLRTLADIVHELIVREEQTRAAAPITQSMRRYEAPATPEPASPRAEVPSPAISAAPVVTPISRPEPVEQSSKVVEIPRPIHQAYTPAVESPIEVPAPPKVETKVAPVIEPVRPVEPPKAPEPAKPIEVHAPVEPPKSVDLPKKAKESLPSIISLTNQAKHSEIDSAAADSNVLPAAADPLPKPVVTSASAAAKPARAPKVKQTAPEPPPVTSRVSSDAGADSAMFRGLEHSTSETNPALKYGAIAVVGLVVLTGAIWGVRSMTRGSAQPAATVAQSPAPAQTVEQPPTQTQASAAVSPAQKTTLNTAATSASANTESKKETKPESKASTPDAKTVIIASKGGSVPTRPQGDLAAPQVALNSGGTGIGALLTSKSAPTPTLNVKRSMLSPPDVIKRVPPKFPEFARRSNPAGDRVVLNVTVNKDGRVGNVQVVRGHPLFAEAATNAVKQWQYRPAFLNGEAVEATVEVVITFTGR